MYNSCDCFCSFDRNTEASNKENVLKNSNTEHSSKAANSALAENANDNINHHQHEHASASQQENKATANAGVTFTGGAQDLPAALRQDQNLQSGHVDNARKFMFQTLGIFRPQTQTLSSKTSTEALKKIEH